MANLKYSRQRESIKDFLASRKDHPTADTVYAHIRQSYPRISLGTVYRNLALLSSLGEIQKICTGDGPDRFDAATKPHYHFVCTNCHQVLDMDLAFSSDIDQEASRHFDGKIMGHTTNFYGLCGECLKQSGNQEI